jgi:hypothetical protein
MKLVRKTAEKSGRPLWGPTLGLAPHYNTSYVVLPNGKEMIQKREKSNSKPYARRKNFLEVEAHRFMSIG